MFFRNIQVYRMTAGWAFPTEGLEEALDAQSYAPIGLSQQLSCGWEPVTDGQFAYKQGQNLLLQFKVESRKVPGSALKAKVKALDKIQLQTLVLARSAGAVMTEWLAAQEGPIAFAIDRACELKANDESKAVVRYTNSTLDTDNLREHIRQGKVCTSLALTWNDRVSFVLTDQFRIKKIKFLDIIQTEREQNTVDEVAVFQSDFAILTGELAKMLADLVEAFGGEQKAEEDDDLFI